MPKVDLSKSQAEGRSFKRALWSKLWRIGLGTIVIIAGVLMLVLPGPGILGIIAGLAILAPEVPPAERLMHWMRRRFHESVAKARASRKNRA